MKMDKREYKVRNATTSEFEKIGRLLIQVYSQLEGFPKQNEQPDYYKMLANVGDFTSRPGTELLVAVSPENEIAGAVVFFKKIKYYF
jgi:hypothetical protein